MPTQNAVPRSDSARNRIAILQAAREQFAVNGVDAAMTDIAGAAGVAVGTLYRHFATKADLLTAVVGAFVTQLADDAEDRLARVSSGARAFDELVEFARAAVRGSAANHAIRSAATSAGAAPDGSDRQRATAALEGVIAAARDAGDVRDDLHVDDLYMLLIAAPATGSPATLDRWVDLVVFGIAGIGRV